MNQKKLAFWIIAILLATACTGIPTAPENSAAQLVNNARCPSALEINSRLAAAPGETIFAAVAPASVDLQYSWTSIPAAKFNPPDGSITEIELPQTGESVLVTVNVSNNGAACDQFATIEIAVEATPASTLTPTETSQPTETPTTLTFPTETPTSTPTMVPTATNTPSPEPTATLTPLPSNTPSPTIPSFEIWLQEPKNETCVSSENAVFQWLSPRLLNNIEGVNGEYYALNIWADGFPVRSISWIKEARYEIDNIDDPIAVYTQQINCSGDNGCYWNVDLIVSHVERGSGWKPDSFTTIESSPVRRFCTYANPVPQPTNTPAPPPTQTPDDGLPPRSNGD
ncbi:MAG: hypothetical protein DHS20C20_07350 [Ardenticatenaceae bacterium]|nr:MAG: hypothetical protein DHS20C20_07350 [Ardenticatenaceae bacterium]